MLSAHGVAFIHHSNMGAYEPGTYDSTAIHWRARTMSAPVLERLAQSAGSCISQETVAWGNELLLNDCFSVIVRAGSRWDRENVVVETSASAGTKSTHLTAARPSIRRPLAT